MRDEPHDRDPRALADERPLHVLALTRERRVLRRDEASALAAGEGALHRAADVARSERMDGGGLLAGLGVIALGWGTTFAAADFTSDAFSRRQQDGVAAAFLVGGAVSTVIGLRSLVMPSTAEVSWRGNNQSKCGRVSAGSAPTSIAFQAGPLAGGGASAGMSGTF